MTDNNYTAPGITFWIISGAALIWNLFGLMIYYMTVTITPEELAARFQPDQVVYIEAVPVWVTSAFAIAVTTAVIGSVLLLLRKSLAVPVFLVSLVAVLTQHTYSFILTDVIAVLGMLQAYIAGTVLTITVLLVLYSLWARKRGLLT